MTFIHTSVWYRQTDLRICSVYTCVRLLRQLRGKESACNAGDLRDLGSVPGREDPLDKEMTTHPSILTWRIPWMEEPGGYSPWGHRELDTTY